jgi:hypothetical protein
MVWRCPQRGRCSQVGSSSLSPVKQIGRFDLYYNLFNGIKISETGKTLPTANAKIYDRADSIDEPTQPKEEGQVW